MSTSRIDLNRVAIFVEIVASGGVTAAAAKLDLPKSSVSRALKHIEDRLGVPLIVRTSRAFALTDAGQAFYEASSRGIAQVEGARDEIRRGKDSPHGLVRIAAPAFGVWMLPPIIAKFTRQHPEVEVDFQVRGGAVDPVRDGFDLVVTTERLEDSSSMVRRLRAVEHGIFASARYLEERGTPRRPSDLAKHDCILIGGQGLRARWKLVGANGSATEVAVRGRLRFEDVAAGALAASEHAGLAVLPLDVPTALGNTALVRVLPQHVVPGESLKLVYPATRHVPLRVSLLMDAIASSAPASCPRSPETVASRPTRSARPKSPARSSFTA